eukprot:scaffold11674_cov60-Phaeocystis_antarctica.AAC.3
MARLKNARSNAGVPANAPRLQGSSVTRTSCTGCALATHPITCSLYACSPRPYSAVRCGAAPTAD